MVARWSNPKAIIECMRAAQEALRPDYVTPEERARDHLAAAADIYRENGHIEAFKRTKNLLTRLTPKEPDQ